MSNINMRKQSLRKDEILTNSGIKRQKWVRQDRLNHITFIRKDGGVIVIDIVPEIDTKTLKHIGDNYYVKSSITKGSVNFRDKDDALAYVEGLKKDFSDIPSYKYKGKVVKFI